MFVCGGTLLRQMLTFIIKKLFCSYMFSIMMYLLGKCATNARTAHSRRRGSGRARYEHHIKFKYKLLYKVYRCVCVSVVPIAYTIHGKTMKFIRLYVPCARMKPIVKLDKMCAVDEMRVIKKSQL